LPRGGGFTVGCGNQSEWGASMLVVSSMWLAMGLFFLVLRNSIASFMVEYYRLLLGGNSKRSEYKVVVIFGGIVLIALGILGFLGVIN
jgi:hypothetical protein